MITTRFAPSPTGDLHLGGAWTALASWALARSSGGRTVLRVEDIDTPRVVAGSAARILEDLAWLGLDWDEGPIVQSARTSAYEAALARLDAAGLVYPCDCSRAEIARAASAPHAGEESKETIYPGTCRDAPRDRAFKRLPAIRLRVPDGARVAFEDAVAGAVEEDVARAAGDFVLRRGDGVFAYQLVVAIDDAEMGVSHVVRADDLLGSTARQVLLMRLLGHAAAPSYAHVPLVVAPDGARLAKRTRGATTRELAEAGVAPEAIVGALARGLGLVPPGAGPLTPREVAAALRPPSAWRRTPWPMPLEWSRSDQGRSAK
ncbi:MAG: tRNA glutamyl-Q(34) synthetase GluQRS [Labilithrix sp.]|nr:tRNA glutamyl-Q(34) synthetase GluQRS [Labilithrix sp.]